MWLIVKGMIVEDKWIHRLMQKPDVSGLLHRLHCTPLFAIIKVIFNLLKVTNDHSVISHFIRPERWFPATLVDSNAHIRFPVSFYTTSNFATCSCFGFHLIAPSAQNAAERQEIVKNAAITSWKPYRRGKILTARTQPTKYRKLF